LKHAIIGVSRNFQRSQSSLKIFLLPTPCQHGFMKRGSTTTIPLEHTSFMIKRFKKQLQTDHIYSDFSKAFDSVNHVLLVKDCRTQIVI